MYKKESKHKENRVLTFKFANLMFYQKQPSKWGESHGIPDRLCSIKAAQQISQEFLSERGDLRENPRKTMEFDQLLIGISR